jgi:hypothetical protein
MFKDPLGEDRVPYLEAQLRQSDTTLAQYKADNIKLIEKNRMLTTQVDRLVTAIFNITERGAY